MERVSVAAEQLDDREGDGVGTARRARGEDAVRALLIGGWMGDQVVAVGAVEGPDHEQMREALDVGEAGLERAQDFEFAFGIVFGAKAARN